MMEQDRVQAHDGIGQRQGTKDKEGIVSGPERLERQLSLVDKILAKELVPGPANKALE